MAANLGQKSTVNAGLALCLDAANPYSNPISRQGETHPPWNDLSENKIDGTIQNSPTYSNVGASSYIEFNTGGGSAEYYKMVSDYYSNVTWGANPYAIEIWVNRYDGAYLLDMRNASDSIHPYIQFNASQSNRLSYRPYNASAIFDTDTDQPSATDTTYTGWRHYVISREGTGSNECKLYYNGSFVAQGTDAETQVTPQDFDIGVRSYDDATSFKGRLGLYKIYNGKSLSATEVLQNYNATKVRYD